MHTRDELKMKEARFEDRSRGLEFELLETNKEHKIIVDKLMTDYGIATKE